MSKELEVSFKTMLSKSEYTRLAKEFADKPANLQTNYYFDTPRFTLKASEIVLRVRKRERYELTLRRKKGYNKIELTNIISEEEFKHFVETGEIPSAEIKNEISDIIKDQTLCNYMSLETYRIFFPYKHGTLAIDKCSYVNKTDYELEFEGTSYEQTKREFVETVKDFNVTYKKGDTKIKRAYEALKKLY